jgi:hypothetical protein
VKMPRRADALAGSHSLSMTKVERRESSRALQHRGAPLALVTDIDQLSVAISHATAPAFMLGAVAAFLSILIARLERIADKNKALRSPDASLDPPGVVASSFAQRMELLSRAIFLAVLKRPCDCGAADLRLFSGARGNRTRAGRGDDVHPGAAASDGLTHAAGARNPCLHGPHAPRMIAGTIAAGRIASA